VLQEPTARAMFGAGPFIRPVVIAPGGWRVREVNWRVRVTETSGTPSNHLHVQRIVTSAYYSSLAEYDDGLGVP
jgi:hypothetical protein